MSPALALAAAALEIEDQLPMPGGEWLATYDSAAASFSPSPLDDAEPMTLFIHPCIGQGFWPFAPQSNSFGPAAALPDGAGPALDDGATLALALAVATAVPAALADVTDAALAVVTGAALADVEAVVTTVLSGEASAAAEPSFSLPQPTERAAPATAAKRSGNAHPPPRSRTPHGALE